VLRESKTYLYVHVVWATWDRSPLLLGEVKNIAYQCIERECQKMKARVIAIGGVEDHMHLLVDMPPTLPIASLMKQVKGSSAHFVHNRPGGGAFFKWQGAYAAYSVSYRDVPHVIAYIQNQEHHHRNRSEVADMEIPEPPPTEILRGRRPTSGSS